LSTETGTDLPPRALPVRGRWYRFLCAVARFVARARIRRFRARRLPAERGRPVEAATARPPP